MKLFSNNLRKRLIYDVTLIRNYEEITACCYNGGKNSTEAEEQEINIQIIVVSIEKQGENNNTNNLVMCSSQ